MQKVLPLNDSWKFKTKVNVSHVKGQEASQWKSEFKDILIFDTVNDFWGMWNAMDAYGWPACFFSLFKQVPNETDKAEQLDFIEPEWEHPENAKGCSFHLYTLDQTLILRVVLYAIGTPNEFLNGVSFDYRKTKAKVTIWLNKYDEEIIKDILSAIEQEEYGKLDNHEELLLAEKVLQTQVKNDKPNHKRRTRHKSSRRPRNVH